MKIYSVLLIVTLTCYLCAQQKKSIAVLELEAGGISKYETQVLSDRLRTELFKTGNFIVLERDKMDEILMEQGFQLSGCTTNECVVEAGKLMGVEQMVAGNVAKIGRIFTLNIRLIDVETGKVLNTATEDCDCTIEVLLTKAIKSVALILSDEEIDIEEMQTEQNQIKSLEEKDIKSHPDYKSPTKALVLSFLLPGIGQYYNGDKLKGSLQQFLIMTGIYYAIEYGYDEVLTPSTDYYTGFTTFETKKEVNSNFYLGIGVAVTTWLWSWIDAYSSAKKYNKRLQQFSGHIFELNYRNYTVNMDLGMNQYGIGGQISFHLFVNGY